MPDRFTPWSAEQRAAAMILEEVKRARLKHPKWPSIHHALSVIREEYLELERVAFTDGLETDKKLQADLAKEATQLAATCIRLLTE